MLKEVKSNTRIVTGRVRFSYVNLHTPRIIGESTIPKYSLCILINKEDTETIEKINAAIENAKNKGELLWKGFSSDDIMTPLRDGDRERPEQQEFEGHYYINAATRFKPAIVDRNVNEIDPYDVYSGCYGRVSLEFYPYNQSGNIGIGCGLRNVQKYEDGEYLSGRSSALDDFLENPFDDILK
jgi:hypothetical protein